MAQAVIMPRQGQSVESCIITEWKKKEGDEVREGDILFSYETDKASFDEEAKVGGTLLKILAQEGDDVPVLQNVAVIGAPGENIDEFIQAEAQSETASATQPSSPAAQEVSGAAARPEAAQTVRADGRLAASPRARALAAEQGLNVADAAPTGPSGRIIERDVRKLMAEGPTQAAKAPAAAASVAPAAGAASDYEDVKLSNVRKVIAKSMHASLQNMAQLTITSSFDATEILAYRSRVKETRGMLGLENITLNDIVMFAVSRVLTDHPDLNAHYLDDHMRLFHHVNLGFAVDTPRGLLVPTIFNADTLTLNELAQQARNLAARAQDGAISPDDLSGATFTVTNLGSFGVESFTPVVNPPQVAILGVNTLVTQIDDVDGLAVPYKAMPLSLTFDHRAVDGAPSAKFLQALCRGLADFPMLLAK